MRTCKKKKKAKTTKRIYLCQQVKPSKLARCCLCTNFCHLARVHLEIVFGDVTCSMSVPTMPRARIQIPTLKCSKMLLFQDF